MSNWTEPQGRGRPPLLGHIVYGLMAIGIFTGIAAMLGAIVAYASRRDSSSRTDRPFAAGEASRGAAGGMGGPPADWLDSHWRHIVLVFWYGLAGFLAAGLVTILVGWVPILGWLIAGFAWLALVAWYVYQIVRGWLAYADGRPVLSSREAWLIL